MKSTDDRIEHDAALRPQSLGEYVGQESIKANIAVFTRAARERGDAVDHLLFCGPPGLGKTSLARLVSTEMGSKMHCTSGPALAKKETLAGLLVSLAHGDVLFVDEIHRLPIAVEEDLYPTLEDFRFDLIVGEGANARTVAMPLPKFTMVGATTRSGLLTDPLRDRFGYIGHLELYSERDLTRIALSSAMKMGVTLCVGGAEEIARRSRGTPRLANRLLRRLRDFGQLYGNGSITTEIAQKGLDALKIDRQGLDGIDRRILTAIVDTFGGGPVGLEALASIVGEEPDTIEDAHEPYLTKAGFIRRTPRGRCATDKARAHLDECLR